VLRLLGSRRRTVTRGEREQVTTSFSVPTLVASLVLSILTGYVGSYLWFSRQRAQERRIFGLSLLAEVRSIQRGLARYHERVHEAVRQGGCTAQEITELRDDVRAWRHDLSIYTSNSNRIGLFVPRTAIMVIEFYLLVRWLDTRAGTVAPAETRIGHDENFLRWLEEQARLIHEAQRQSKAVVRHLRHELREAWLFLAWASAVRRLKHVLSW
jgi:hypothetical protein